MYLNQPVPIPEAPGKITFRKKGESTYVQYQLNRVYNPNTKQSRVDRCEIGVQIPGRPELMLPNENYMTCVPKGETEMENEQKETISNYQAEREHCFMLRDFFDQLFFEFQIMSRKKGNSIVNENKVTRLNKVLKPLMDMMAGEEYARFLEIIPEPQEEKTEDGGTVMTGMSYSDVALLMTQYKGALNRFFQKRL